MRICPLLLSCLLALQPVDRLFISLYSSLCPLVLTITMSQYKLWFVGQGVWRDLELLLNTNCCGHTPGIWSLRLKNVTIIWLDTSLIAEGASLLTSVYFLNEFSMNIHPVDSKVIYYWFCTASTSIPTVFQGWMDHGCRVKTEQIARA
jgi:hypothetical protein